MAGMPLRILIATICLPVAAFSVFGFLASFEPGVGPSWKVGYAVVFLSSLAAAVVPWVNNRAAR